MGTFKQNQQRLNKIVFLLFVLTSCLAAWNFLLSSPRDEPARITIPVNPQAITTPPPEYHARALLKQRYFPNLIQEIDDADSSIYIIMYLYKPANPSTGGFRPQKILLHLKKALERGVTVKMVLDRLDSFDPYQAKEHWEAIDFLEHKNFRGYVNPRTHRLHSKAVIIDKKTAIVGAHNWTWHSLNKTHETSLLIKSNQPINPLLEEFNTLFKTAQRHYPEDEDEL